MNKESLNFEPFYEVEPMRIIDDPVQSFNELMKYDKEKTEIEMFLKDCSIKDLIWVIITLFKDKYANASLLGALVSTAGQKEEKADGVLFHKKFQYRNDLTSLQFKYDKNDHFEYLEFEIIEQFENIHSIIEEALSGKTYVKKANSYILNSNSGIEYIEATSTFFRLNANMKMSQKFH
ncbi:hypothetical protein [Chryseobacterium sp. JK1]|uniref:hypothetical protein n=1 Tax=Chryseobacterium sp. JK1 TaxID=874294 RepID=UPI003D68B428